MKYIFYTLLILAGFFLTASALANHTPGGSNIVKDSGGIHNEWAWNDVIGWLNFHETDNVKVPPAGGRIKGFAKMKNIGELALDCATSSSPPAKCDDPPYLPGNWGVDLIDPATGKLSGWAWNDQIGWISFCGNETEYSEYKNSKWKCPSRTTYQVTILPGNNPRDFSGWAWNDVIGWISFNCNNSGISNTCATVDYKVKVDLTPPILPTASLTSSVFDTCPTDDNCGATLNTIMWKGTQPTNDVNYVTFQIATECLNPAESLPLCPGGWKFIGPADGFLRYYDTPGPDKPIKIDTKDHGNKRYFRYKVYLNPKQSQGPVVEDVIINWSP